MERVRVLSVECVLYSVRSCALCKVLQEIIIELLASPENAHIANKLSIRVMYTDEADQKRFNKYIKPRMVPTVIAYKDNVPKLGWEGFAAMEPSEIQKIIVLDVLTQAAELSEAQHTKV
jgi:hypothetical protein